MLKRGQDQRLAPWPTFAPCKKDMVDRFQHHRAAKQNGVVELLCSKKVLTNFEIANSKLQMNTWELPGLVTTEAALGVATSGTGLTPLGVACLAGHVEVWWTGQEFMP